MKKKILLAAILLLILIGCGCSAFFLLHLQKNNSLDETGENEQACQEVCSSFLDEVIAGDWEQAMEYLIIFQEGHGAEKKMFSGKHIFGRMMRRMTYTIDRVDEQKDGSVIADMTITAVDYEKMLEALPQTISMKKEARKALLGQVDTAETKAFAVQVTLLKDYENNYRIEINEQLANALTGGFYDILEKAVEEAAENEF